MAGSWTPSAAAVCAYIFCVLLASVLGQPTEAQSPQSDPFCGDLPAPLPVLPPKSRAPLAVGPFVVSPEGTTVLLGRSRRRRGTVPVFENLVFQNLCTSAGLPLAYTVYINKPSATLGTGTEEGTGFAARWFLMAETNRTATYRTTISDFLVHNRLKNARSLNITIVPSMDGGSNPVITGPSFLSQVAAVVGNLTIEYTTV